ncbi:hypothetical protein [Virgibacillus sp. L01]|uniref:hypothetical protein n=1 Tax=Virgibacillus sp. L01 TaxID=3457429 RepID=UPI003FD53462
MLENRIYLHKVLFLKKIIQTTLNAVVVREQYNSDQMPATTLADMRNLILWKTSNSKV